MPLPPLWAMMRPQGVGLVRHPIEERESLEVTLADYGVPYEDVTAMTVDARDRLWIGTTRGAIRKLRDAKVDRVAPVVDPRSGTIKVTVEVEPGDRLVVLTPGGGGWGSPKR